MADLTRRAALQLGGGAGLGGLLAGVGVGQPPVAGPALGGVQGRVPPPTGPYSGSSIQRAAQGLLDREERQRCLRIDGLDPSLAALKSVSPAMKHLIQAKRDDDRASWIIRVRKAAWG
jgi:hypothetical protein